MIDRLAKKAEKMEAERELEAAAERARQEEEDRAAIREGKIYLKNFHMYSKEDIQRITDIDFLNEMHWAIMPAGQPPDPDDFEALCDMSNAIMSRIEVLSK